MYIVIGPRVKVKAVEGDALFADRNLDQKRPHFFVEAVAIHPEIEWRIPQADKARQQHQCAESGALIRRRPASQ